MKMKNSLSEFSFFAPKCGMNFKKWAFALCLIID